MTTIKTYSELTWVLMIHAPIAYQAHLNNTLDSSESWVGSSPFFYFNPLHFERRGAVTYTESAAIYDRSWKLRGIPPDYKGHFRNDIFQYDKPIVIINNKYISEWKKPPINFIGVDDLRSLCSILTQKYTVVYIRSETSERGYWNDNQPAFEFGDYAMLRSEFPMVVCMNDLLEKHSEYDYNTLQLMLHANCEKFISIAGGNAVISSYFGGTNIIYRNPAAGSDSRVLWHTNSHLSQLSGAKILGTNNNVELIEMVSHWNAI